MAKAKGTKRIEKRGDQWCVVSHRTGRSLGCYDTHAEAVERLRQIQGHTHPERNMFEDMTEAELEALLLKLDGKDATDTSHEEPPTPPTAKEREANTLYIAPLLWGQIMSYQRKLIKVFDKGVDALGSTAENGGSGETAMSAVEAGFLSLAPAFFEKAYGTGADFAARHLGGSQQSEAQVAKAIKALVDKNKGFVQDSLIPALGDKYKAALMLGTTEAKVKAVEGISDSMGARVGMYALQLWGAGHKGFHDEAKAADQLMDWVVTSGAPCNDCPRLEDGSPYGTEGNPLPTFPGAGDTECLSNCLCLLRIHTGKAKGFEGARGYAGVVLGGAPAREAADKMLAALQQANGIGIQRMKADAARIKLYEDEAKATAERHEQSLRSAEHMASELQGLRAEGLAGVTRIEDLEVKLAVLATKHADLQAELEALKKRKRKVVKRVERDSAGFAVGSVEEEVDG